MPRPRCTAYGITVQRAGPASTRRLPAWSGTWRPHGHGNPAGTVRRQPFSAYSLDGGLLCGGYAPAWPATRGGAHASQTQQAARYAAPPRTTYGRYLITFCSDVSPRPRATLLTPGGLWFSRACSWAGSFRRGTLAPRSLVCAHIGRLTICSSASVRLCSGSCCLGSSFALRDLAVNTGHVGHSARHLALGLRFLASGLRVGLGARLPGS